MDIPFDNNEGEKYTFEIIETQIETGDGIILTLNRKACLAYADFFKSLAKQENGCHIHLGYDQDEPQGPGFRVVLQDDT